MTKNEYISELNQPVTSTDELEERRYQLIKRRLEEETAEQQCHHLLKQLQEAYDEQKEKLSKIREAADLLLKNSHKKIYKSTDVCIVNEKYIDRLRDLLKEMLDCNAKKT